MTGRLIELGKWRGVLVRFRKSCLRLRGTSRRRAKVLGRIKEPMNKKTSARMARVASVLERCGRQLGRTVKELEALGHPKAEDVRAIEALNAIRESTDAARASVTRSAQTEIPL